jgi:hypothetical protein
VAAGVLLGAAIVASTHDHQHRPAREVVIVERPVYVNAPPPAPMPPPRDRGEPEENAPGFDAQGARTALGAVDLSACRAAGAPRGYGHAVVTFNPAGNISKVVVDEPNGLSPDAAKCIGDALGKVTVREYKGNLVRVGTSWFVP